ncbi:MAG TPA: chorismate mutase [Gemmatimonadota bacterium]|nr:chorismate mutase [Gemmatimonadota bacterium]
MSTNRTLWGLRGAVTVEADDPRLIVEATERLIVEIMDRNEVAAEEVVSVIFTSTTDLTSEFPAAAARRIGLAEVPLLCATEIPVPGAIGRCVRVLMHVYTERAREELRHVYLGGARALRTDLAE